MDSSSFVQFDNSRVAEAGGLVETAGKAFSYKRQAEQDFVKKVLKDPIHATKGAKGSNSAPAAKEAAPAATPAAPAASPAKPTPKKLTPEEQKKRDDINRRRREKRASDREAGVKPTPRPKPQPKPTPSAPSAPAQPEQGGSSKPAASKSGSKTSATTKYAHILLPIRQPNQAEFQRMSVQREKSMGTPHTPIPRSR